MKKLWIILFCCLLSGPGCATQPAARPRNQVILKNRNNQVVDAQALKEGGKLAVIPFLPGEGVVASRKTESFSLMAVKGIVETLREEGSPFEVVMSEKAEEAQIFIKGFIIRMEKPGGLKRWLPGKKVFRAAVSGKMYRLETREVLLYFYEDIAQPVSGDNDMQELGYRLGRKIGQYIVAQIQ